jgi:hypothetical protein
VVKSLFCCFRAFASLYHLSLCDFADSFCLRVSSISVVWALLWPYLACMCTFFPYPADVFLNSITGVASLGLLHSCDVFSQVINLFLEPSFPWWGLFVFL